MASCKLLVVFSLLLVAQVSAISVETRQKDRQQQLLDEVQNRQAIPLAVVQVSTLRIFPPQNKQTESQKTTAPITSLDKRLQNYSPFIKNQAEQDIRLRKIGGRLNITESIYNGSIAFAIDNNKTTAILNNTIHLLQNATPSGYDVSNRKMTVSLSEVTNKTLEKRNKTITIPIMDFSIPDHKNVYTQMNLPFFGQLPQNKSSAVIFDLKNKKEYVFKNSSNIEKINMTENIENFQKTVKVQESKVHTQHSLPSHVTHIYYLNKFAYKNSSNNSKVPEEARIKDLTEEQGVLVGPLDTLPNHPNGNGPQDKKLKDLGTPGKVGSGKNNSRKGKKVIKEAKQRRKRQLFSFRGPGMRMPWDYAIDSEQFEHNGNINEQNRNFFIPQKSSQNLFLKNLYETSTDANTNLARESVARARLWLPSINSFTNLNRKYEDEQKQNYNKFLEHEANEAEVYSSPIIGSNYNIESLMHHTNQPTFHSPLIVDEDAEDRNELQRGYQKAYIPINKLSANFDSSFISNEFDANTNGLPPTARGLSYFERYNTRKNPRDQIIENFLNNYDEQTKKMSSYYNQQNTRRNLDFGLINPEQLTDPEFSLDSYRSREFHNSHLNSPVTYNGNYFTAPTYQDQRRDILLRHSDEPFELDIRAKVHPSYIPLNNFPHHHALNSIVEDFLQNPYSYKRTIESSSLLSNLNDFSPVNLLTPQQAAQLNMGIPENYGMNFFPAGDQQRDDVTKQQGVVMLMVTTPLQVDEGDEKVPIEHRELTHDGITRVSSNVTNDDGDFSINLKKAADFVLTNAVSQGNITVMQRDAIEQKLNTILEKHYKNKTRGEMGVMTRENIPRVCQDTISDCEQLKTGGVCPFMTTFMKGTCTKTCNDCSNNPNLATENVKSFIQRPENLASFHFAKGSQRSLIETTSPRKFIMKSLKIPDDPVMYLTFEYANQDGVVEDSSTNKNNALLEKGAALSPRVLGTCGKAVELNEGSVTWSGEEFKRKPDVAISIAMYVKVKKSGVINWFANGKTGDKKFYAKTKKTVVPAKVWTHVAGTYDSESGLARIYINGELEQEQTQRKGEKLSKDWLVNGIGTGFGDDSLHYADEVLIYDRALTQSEIKMLFNRCMFNRMILHFGFQKGNKTSMSDQSGLDNDAILVGGARQKEEGEKCGYCLDLTNGPDPAMKIEQIAVKKLPRTKISIALWVSLNNTNGIHNIFTTESSEGNIGYRLQVVNGRVRWAIGTDTVPVLFDHMTESQVVPEALWTHIVTTYNNENGVVKIYVNSKEKLKEVVPEERREFLPTNWDNDASIGDRTFRGYIDEFIMYNWDLDSSEALYVRNYCADHPKLVRFTVRVPLTKKNIVPHANKLLLKQGKNSNPYQHKNPNIRSYQEQPRTGIVINDPSKQKSDTKQLNFVKKAQSLKSKNLLDHTNTNNRHISWYSKPNRKMLRFRRTVFSKKEFPVPTTVSRPKKSFLQNAASSNRPWDYSTKFMNERKTFKTQIPKLFALDEAFVLLQRHKKSENT